MINDPESTILASMNLALTTGAPKGWTPSQNLMTHKPPYPTEDLIRRSTLYQMMTQSTTVSSVVLQESTKDAAPTEVKPAAAPVRSRRRGAATDKSKLLDLDLNPDM